MTRGEKVVGGYMVVMEVFVVHNGWFVNCDKCDLYQWLCGGDL